MLSRKSRKSLKNYLFFFELTNCRPKVQRDKPPLYRMEFGLIGKLDRSRDEIKSDIERLGGKLVSSVHDKMAAIISNEVEVKKINEKMQKAKTFGIQVVPLKFLDDVKAGNAIKYIKTLSICDWGTDVSDCRGIFISILVFL